MGGKNCLFYAITEEEVFQCIPDGAEDNWKKEKRILIRKLETKQRFMKGKLSRDLWEMRARKWVKQADIKPETSGWLDANQVLLELEQDLDYNFNVESLLFWFDKSLKMIKIIQNFQNFNLKLFIPKKAWKVSKFHFKNQKSQ